MRRLSWILLFLLMIVGAVGGGVCYTLYDQYWSQLPPLDGLLQYRPAVATRVYADDGSLVGEFYFEKRYLTPIEEISPMVRYAFVAAEDSEFYSHHGIDVTSIVRAFIANMMAGNVVQGGSTITQQVVKSLLLTPERSYRRKLREVMLSLRLERELTKNEILYLYLNEIYLGDGNYGVGAAARAYFGKKVSELTLPEAALLAGLPQAPSRYSPTRNPQGALVRQRYVLKRMLEEGFITESEYETALNTGVAVLPRSHAMPSFGSYYIEYVRQYLEEHFGKQAPYHQGFRVYTGMNVAMQQEAERAVRSGARNMDMQLGYRGPTATLSPEEMQERLTADRARTDLEELYADELYEGVVTKVGRATITVDVGQFEALVDVSKLKWLADVKSRRFHVGDVVKVTASAGKDGVAFQLSQEPQLEAALLAIDPGSGQVKAMVGGYDFNRSEFNRAIQARRQPGSAFKPFIYAAAIDNGYTPASIILDAPIQYIDHDKIWRPQNYSRQFYGPTTLRKALEKSRNVVTVRVVQDLGVNTVVDYVRQFGFTTPIGANLSIGLGTSEVSLLDLTHAYSIFADGGDSVEPVLITRIEDSAGRVMFDDVPKVEPVISPQTAYLLTSMMQGVVERGTGRGVRSINRPVAGKTGTTNEQRDAWFMGYTPNLVAGVWVGFDEDKTLGATGTGGRVAAPVWLDFMKSALADKPVLDFTVPDGISCVNIDPESGLRARDTEIDSVLECFKEGTEPVEFAPEWKVDPTQGPNTLILGEEPEPPAPLRPDVIEKYRTGQIFQ